MGLIGVIFIMYLILLLGIGIRTFRYNKTQEDYLLAGRSLGPWVTAFSERASGESAWLLLALPGAAIAIGLGEFWSVIGIVIGIISSWLLVAKKIRQETEKYNALTIPDYFHKRYKDESNIIRLFSTAIIAFFFLFYVSAQFHASGKVLNTLFNIDQVYGIIIGATIIILYTLLGGFYAVAWTDFIQGILMISTLIILPLVGFFEIYNNNISIPRMLESASVVFGNSNSSFFMGRDGILAVVTVLGGLSWGLGYLGQPHLIIRYMAIRDAKDIKIARNIAIAWAVPGVFGAFMVGIISLAYFGPDYFQINDPEKSMPLLATALLHPVLAGLFISGAVAAMMSTADSQLLVSTSAITEDFFHQYMKKDLSEKDLLLLNRIMILILGFIAFGIAIYSQVVGNNIFGVVSYAWSGLGSAFGPALIMTLWWSKTTRKGVIVGMIVGFITTIVWSNIPDLKGIITERVTSFVFSLVAVCCISVIDKNEN
ncbi:MAG: sodium:proline symporter [Candidatus Marinimicrobia bacterium]|nr:sodium:proline symporter [Candidatus Neomarinimicrobiota bacterium]|tara:strand:+ start:11545 stop:12996 length:1452 start_codon:yes stop_codon:yes gene_type:complete